MCEVHWPGTTECSGNGECTAENICICKDNWSGVGDWVNKIGIDCTVHVHINNIITAINLVVCMALVIYTLRRLIKATASVDEALRTDNGPASSVGRALGGGGHTLHPRTTTTSNDLRDGLDRPNSKSVAALEQSNSAEKKTGCSKFAKNFLLVTRLQLAAKFDMCGFFIGFGYTVYNMSKLLANQYLGHNILPSICFSISTGLFYSLAAYYSYNLIATSISIDIKKKGKLRKLLKQFKCCMISVFVYSWCVLPVSSSISFFKDDPKAYENIVAVSAGLTSIIMISLGGVSSWFGRAFIKVLTESMPKNKKKSRSKPSDSRGRTGIGGPALEDRKVVMTRKLKLYLTVVEPVSLSNFLMFNCITFSPFVRSQAAYIILIGSFCLPLIALLMCYLMEYQSNWKQLLKKSKRRTLPTKSIRN